METPQQTISLEIPRVLSNAAAIIAAGDKNEIINVTQGLIRICHSLNEGYQAAMQSVESHKRFEIDIIEQFIVLLRELEAGGITGMVENAQKLSEMAKQLRGEES